MLRKLWPDYLDLPAERLGKGTPVKVRILGDMASLGQDLAEVILAEIKQAQQQGRNATFIVPVGPVDHYPILANAINQQRIDCRNVMFINMDEYLTDENEWLPIEHPLSFRGYMDRRFYDLVDSSLAPVRANRLFPDSRNPAEIGAVIADRGGVDACFGGIGINGHLAFNEPAGTENGMSLERFAALPTRCLDLTRETRTINAVTVGGEISIIPRRAITVGMKEILAARKLRFYCNRPWQSAVLRRALHGPISPSCPASLLRLHPDATLTIADYVARPPEIRLR